MKRLLLASFAIVAMSASTAKADLVLNISGVVGSGVTTFEFVDSSGTTTASGRIGTNTGNPFFNRADTMQFEGSDAILDPAIQDQVFVLTGTATVTIGALTESITGIFLDDDGIGPGDDLGIRAANELDYVLGDTSSWTGIGTANIDISTFAEGSFLMNFGTAGLGWFVDGNNSVVNISYAVPEPTGLVIAGIAAIGFIARRRRV